MSVFNDMLDEVVSDLQSLISAGTLTDIESNEVVKRKFPWTHDYIYKGITVHPGRESEAPGNTGCDDIIYPCLVTMVQGSIGIADDIDRITQWRQVIRKHYIHQRPSTASIQTVRVRFGEVFLPRQFRDNYDAGTLALLCLSREDRTN